MVSLIGQFVIDFILVGMFQNERETALQSLAALQAQFIINLVFYDLAACWFLGQVLLGIAKYRNRNTVYPLWAVMLFFAGLILLIAGPVFHTLIARLSYALLSISFVSRHLMRT